MRFFLAGSSVLFPGNLDSIGAWSAAIEERILEEERELQEAEDYIEEEREHMVSSQNLVNLTGAAINLEKIPQNECSEEPRLEQAEVTEEDVLNLPIAELRWAFMSHLLKPVVEMEEVEENTVKSNGKLMFQCPDCKFRGPSISHLKRHRARLHTPWAILLKSFQGLKVCVCPEGDHTVQKPCRMVKHLLTKCKERDKYIEMHRAAEVERDHFRKGEVGYKKPEKKYKITEKKGKRAKRMREEDAAEDSESDDHDKESEKEQGREITENKGKKPTKRMRKEDLATDSESSDHDSWHEDSTLDIVEPFTRVLRKRNPAPAPAEDEEGLLVESITKQTLKQKLNTKKPLPTLLNLLRSVCDEVEYSGLYSTALNDDTPDLDALGLLSLEDCMS
ncbi:hypothetical protein HYPSUDRAFT_1032129 [Hypholoma sublateritium FD-334 SS-4]|uniref:Uncharacterized protein n=1 Tax=Hypholoma sublateritium (strain FD-334 SS-4) TaxID=945553 RepID=A0A0D2PE25_HYPSF|nr:hypothetical protein HYPSUDRAFT_1032129 [Hypholoma sublateritium FD-334 SS-4]